MGIEWHPAKPRLAKQQINPDFSLSLARIFMRKFHCRFDFLLFNTPSEIHVNFESLSTFSIMEIITLLKQPQLKYEYLQ